VRANRLLGGYLLPALVVAAAFPSLPARAVVNAGGNANLTAPADDPGFANVGSTGGASIIYLGNRWAITASHVFLGNAGYPQWGVSPYSFSIANSIGATYGPGQINEFGAADLRLINLTIDPGLPSLSIDTRAPRPGDAVMMIGNGRPQAGLTQEYWNVTTPVSGSTWTWTSTAAPSSVTPIPSNFFTNYYNNVNPPVPAGTYQASAVAYSAGQQIRWGLNQITSTLIINNTTGFSTTFNDPRFAPGGATAAGGNEAQASIGDSGGAVFFKNGTSWKLDGLMIANDLYPNKPDSLSAAFGEPSYMADLTSYRNTIVRAITPLAWTGLTSSSWDTVSHNWNNTLDLNQTYYDVSSPVFNDLGIANSSVVIQSAGVLPAAVSFNNSPLTTYTFSDSGTSTVGITGSTGITKTGTGQVALAGANSFTGPVQISAGRITLQASNALGGSSGVVVSSGAALELQNAVSAGTSTTSPATTIPLTIYGTGLASNPAGALNSSNGSSEYKGVITIGAGGATINSAAIGSLLTLSGGISTSGNPLTLSGPGNIAINSNIWGSGSMIKTGAGYLSLTGANSYTGGTSINNGLVLTSTLGNPSNPVVVSAATGVTTALVLSSNSNQSVGSLAGTVGSGGSAVLSIGALSTLTVNQATNTNFAGTLQNSGTFIKSGSGTLEIDGAPQLFSNAAIQVNGGTLKFNLAAPATASVGSGVTVSVASGATLQLAGNSPALSGGGNYADIANESQAAGGGLAITGSGQQIGAITGAGSTIVSGDGDLTASSIIQGALVIAGSDGGSFGSVTIRDSSATGGTLASSAGHDTSTAAASTQWLADALASMPASASSLSMPPQDFGAVGFGSQPSGSSGVPEPSTIGLVLIAAASWAAICLRRSRS
jgi:autotransporter-associated beta strand protein